MKELWTNTNYISNVFLLRWIKDYKYIPFVEWHQLNGNIIAKYACSDYVLGNFMGLHSHRI